MLSRLVAIRGVQRNSTPLSYHSMLNGKCQKARLKKKKVLVQSARLTTYLFTDQVEYGQHQLKCLTLL